MASSASRGHGGMFLGFVLVALGIVFLINQVGGEIPKNWWALFIMIPALNSFTTAIHAFRAAGRMDETARGSLGGGLIVLTLALIFLFDLPWNIYWPVMLVVPGLVILFNGLTLAGSGETNLPLSHRLYRPWTGWVGLGVVYLGLGFLLKNLGVFDPATILPRWWALAILIPALGGLLTAIRLAVSGSGGGWAAVGNLFAVAVFAVVGVIAFFGGQWSLILPVALIAAGLILLSGIFRRI